MVMRKPESFFCLNHWLALMDWAHMWCNWGWRSIGVDWHWRYQISLRCWELLFVMRNTTVRLARSLRTLNQRESQWKMLSHPKSLFLVLTVRSVSSVALRSGMFGCWKARRDDQKLASRGSFVNASPYPQYERALRLDIKELEYSLERG